MKLLFGGSTIFTAFFALLGAAGFVNFEILRAEAIGTKSFEFFLMLLFFTAGVRGLFAHRQTPTLFEWAGRAVTTVKAIYISVSGALVGWVIGITLLVLFKGEPANVALGLILVFLMSVLTGPPLMWVQDIELQANDFLMLHIKEQRFSLVFRLICITLIVIASWGFIKLLG